MEKIIDEEKRILFGNKLKRHFDFDKFIIMSSRLGSKNLSTNYKKKKFP
uniref:Uncharacterized protein n=1 Tax=Meloidogyne enterolobii TaxID=390850 RepID=A0A6V7V327_MELEN|nr:unnamed protein product [Meloidogyne enterolobii]